jgi:hypothetical protein
MDYNSKEYKRKKLKTKLYHDFEGFNSVLKRHGFWEADLELTGETAQQLELPFDNERPNLEVVRD